MTDETPSAAEMLRAARGIVALQARVSGRVRHLAGADAAAPVETSAAAADVAPADAAAPVAAMADSVADAAPEAVPDAVSSGEAGTASCAPAPPDPVSAPEPAATPDPTLTGPPPADPPPAAHRPPPSDSVPDLFGALPDPSLDPSLSPYERIEALIPEASPLREMASLDEIHDYLARTVLVPIDEGRINPVLGVGDPHADLMIIGEAPGADEDRLGEPFVGRSGQLLDKILEAVLFDRSDVYITNILKSRPPNNRDPLADEVAAHIPILYKQIALVRPKILLAVGKSAGNGLLGKTSSLANLRGSVQDFYGLPMIVTYHPAALLRNPQWKRPTWEDVKLLRTRYDQLVEASGQ